MFPIYFFPRYFITKNKDKGVTLVELLIVLALISLISAVMGSLFFTGIHAYNTVDQQIECYANGRWAFMNIERQIKGSEEIFIKDGRVYLQDLENPILYNYYTLSSGKMMKHKVDKDSLAVILGGTSQFAERINRFEISHLEGSTLNLEVVSELEGKTLHLNSRIRVGVKITNK